MIKIVYYVIHINFPIKSVDSCWIEVVNMKFMEKYITLTSIVKTWDLKNIKTKNILAAWRKVKCQEKVLQNFSTLTTLPTFSSRLLFYPRPTVIYVLVFLPSAVLSDKKTFISLSSSTKPSFKKHFINILFSFKPKTIPNYRSRCVSIRFLERIDSYLIRLESLSESERSNHSPLRKSAKNLFHWK